MDSHKWRRRELSRTIFSNQLEEGEVYDWMRRSRTLCVCWMWMRIEYTSNPLFCCRTTEEQKRNRNTHWSGFSNSTPEEEDLDSEWIERVTPQHHPYRSTGWQDVLRVKNSESIVGNRRHRFVRSKVSILLSFHILKVEFRVLIEFLIPKISTLLPVNHSLNLILIRAKSSTEITSRIQ